MMLNVGYLLLAILGLGLLVFIHELGHYIVAKRSGMKIEIFSIGFGPAILQWEAQGVKWQLSLLPFGGYVRIAGMEKQKELEPYQIPNGFYGKTPWQRIKVALAGPISNIIFAFISFTLIWIFGGQDKQFQEITHIVGHVDSESSLKTSKVNPGDLISLLNGKTYGGYSDLVTKLALSHGDTHLEGEHIDYFTGRRNSFFATLPVASSPQERINAFAALPAQYLIFEAHSSPTSPLQNKGIDKGDRLIWADGSLLFSQKQLSSILNCSMALLTIQRGNQIHQIQVPLPKITDLLLTTAFKHELEDWKHAASMEKPLGELYFIPYHIDFHGKVEGYLLFIHHEAASLTPERLQKEDQILAVNGTPIHNASDLFKLLQERKTTLIVQKNTPSSPVSWKEADRIFESSFDLASLKQLLQTLGTPTPKTEVGNLRLLSSIELKSLADLQFDPSMQSQMAVQYETQKREIQKIADPEEREEQLSLLDQSQKRRMLGVQLIDRPASYNPPPTTLFASVFDQTWKTLENLFRGSLTPKSMSGPVGIIQALQYSWQSGIKDALYWLGFVSLNLAILNLLPIPVLDGGHIVFSFIEMVTKKPIRSVTMEKWIIPFMVLLIALFIYLTYQDLLRLLRHLF